jgi:hypothetical protein
MKFFDREGFYLTKEEQLVEGKLFWDSLKKETIEADLITAVNRLIPVISSSQTCIEKHAEVVRVVKGVLGCKLPTKNENMIGSLNSDHDGLVHVWMCPAAENCGKMGSTPTAMYCKDCDRVVLNGKCCL